MRKCEQAGPLLVQTGHQAASEVCEEKGFVSASARLIVRIHFKASSLRFAAHCQGFGSASARPIVRNKHKIFWAAHIRLLR